MTISRGQMNRQLYMGGGIMNAIPREQFGLGSKLKKLGKKAVKSVKKIASSDLGKAALIYGATAGLGALGAGAARSGSGFGLLSPSNVFANLGATGSNIAGALAGLTSGSATNATMDYSTPFRSFMTEAGKKIAGGGIKGNLGKLATLGAVSTFLTSQYGMTEEQAEEELARDPSPYLERYYRNLNPSATEEEVASFVAANTSEYAEGGRIMRAEGDTASDNAMQASGIEGLPIRQNPKGVKELDLRKTGGFIPPVGIKEKEDDIPAMLSNNEFVFTADAVRGMGDGDVDVGAQRMYDMMKQLEAGGRV